MTVVDNNIDPESTASKSIPDDLKDIFFSCSEEKHVVPCTYSTTDWIDIKITGVQNANWKYGQFIIFNPQDQNKTVNSYNLNEDQYLIKKDSGKWKLYNNNKEVLASGPDEIRDFVEGVKRKGGKSSYGKKMDGIKQLPLQQIFYGAPGSGKSHKVKLYESAFAKVIRTTFHPDSDYTSFVGTYKPVMVDEILWAPDRGFYPTDARVLKLSGSNDPNRKFDHKKISYEFTPQAFVNAYVEAWKLFSEAFNSSKESEEIEFKNVLLNIEEINRGNCAQIFGDIFQLLDRNRNGVSEYPIVSDYALKQYLEGQFQGLSIDCIDGFYEDKYTSPINEFHTRAKDIKEGNVLILPPNLYIWATMNTSDQSLFPMDSAFKRRWEWEYVPVDHEDAKRFHIFIGGKSYNWDTFISVVNKKIFGATQSADKQLGNRFCKPDATIGIDSDSVEHYMISTKQFMGKVMFYLWEEVCKDAPEEESINFMRICEKLNDPANPVSSEYFSFQELYSLPFEIN